MPNVCRTLFAIPIVAALFLASAPLARAADPELDQNPFRKTYLTLEVARNYPVSFSQNEFEPGRYGLAVGYRYDLNTHWLMGISAGFKAFTRKEEQVTEGGDDAFPRSPTGRLALWTLTHETLYALRLDHPTYLLLGPKLHYLLPAHAAKFPLQRADDYQTEIGVALSMAFTHVTQDGYLLTARLDRWRGTKTMTFHGLEMALGVSIPL